MGNRKVLLAIAVALFVNTSAVYSQTVGNQTQIFVPGNEPYTNIIFPALLKLPSDYNATTTKYPLLVFLHGTGESGNMDGSQLSRIYNSAGAGGPAYFIARNNFPESFAHPVTGVAYKFIILSPQAPGWSTSANGLKCLINDMVAKYRVDTNRIYITGLSAGGQGVMDYVSHNNTVPQYLAAAMVPMSAAFPSNQSLMNVAAADEVKAWGFGSLADSHGATTSDNMNYLNNARPGSARFTAYAGGHCCWNNFYNPNYKEVINGKSMNIYEWMLLNKRGGADAVTANAGSDQSVTLPASSVQLAGTVVEGGPAASYSWSVVAGPNTPAINSPAAAVTSVSGLVEGAYVFKLTVTNTAGASGSANVAVNVNVSGAQDLYYRSITIDKNKISGTQANFPVLISGTYDFLKSTANGGKVDNANGYDIIFTSDPEGNNLLNWEVEKYNPATGELAAWVKTDLSAAADKTIYIHYGNTSITRFQGNAKATWNSGYAAVHHLFNGSGIGISDATTNGNNGTITGATAGTGSIAGGANLNGAPQYINIGNSSTLGITGNITLEAWINPSDFSNYNGIIAKTSGQFPKPYDFYLSQGSGVPQLYRGNGDMNSYGSVAAAAAPAVNSWSHIAVTISGNTVTHYLNGNVNGTGTLPAAGTGGNGTDNVMIGSRSDGATRFKGKIDEVHIVNGTLSAGWIKTEYNNQSSPATFYAIGAEYTHVTTPPVVNAGNDQATTATTITLTGSATSANAAISTYSWTKISGPGTPAITSPAAATTTVTGLTEGVYVFRLTATDAIGQSASDDISITINPTQSGTGGNKYYRIITINHAQVSNAYQSNFPVLITGVYSFLKTTANGGRVENNKGFDIQFTTDVAAANKLNWELEKYDPATGELVAWVQTDVSPTEDKIIYMHYGNSTISSFQGNTNGTRNSSYAAVQHLANGSTLGATDATVNANNGVVNGATAITGKIEGAANMNGSNQSISLGNKPSLGITGNITLEAWINPSDYSNYNGIIGKTSGAYGIPKPYDFYLTQGSGIPQLYRGNGEVNGYANVGANTAPPAGTWSHIAVTINGNTVTHYLNGVVNGTGTLTAAGVNGTENVFIGSRNDGATRFKGKMDEVRIVNGALSADWIKTEYNSQSSPATFYAISDEVGVGTAALRTSGAAVMSAADAKENINEPEIVVYPNPVKDKAVLSVNNTREGKAEVVIMSANGQVVKKLQLAKNTQKVQWTIPVSTLARGTYIIKTTINEWTRSVKLVKL